MDQIDEKLKSFEDKLNDSFYNVEERLDSLEKEKYESGQEALEERLSEVEDLLLLTQLENSKINEIMSTEGLTEGLTERETNPISDVPEDIEEKITHLQSQIENIRQVRVEGKTIEIPDDIETRLSDIEETMSSMGSKQVHHTESKLTHETVSTDYSPVIEENTQRIQEIEEKIKNNPHENNEEVDKKIESLKKELKEEIEKSGSFSNDDLKNFIESAKHERNELMKDMNNFSSAKEEIENAIKHERNFIKKIEESNSNIDKIDAYLSKIENYSEKMKVEIKNVDNSKEELEEKIKSSDEKVRSRLEKIELMKDTFEMKIEELKKNYGEIDDIKKEIKELPINKQLESIEQKMEKEFNSLKDVKKHISELPKKEELDAEFKKLEKKLHQINEVKNENEEENVRIASMEKDIAGLKKIKNELENKTEEMIESHTKNAKKKFKEIKTLESENEEEDVRIGSMEKELLDLKDYSDLKDKTKLSELEEKIGMLENKMSNIKEVRKDQQEDETKITSIEKEIGEITNFAKHVTENVEKDVAEMINTKLSSVLNKTVEISKIKKYHDNENHRIAEIEKDMGELKKEIDNIKDYAKSIESRLGSENVQKLNKKLQDVENKMNQIAIMKKKQNNNEIKKYVITGDGNKTSLGKHTGKMTSNEFNFLKNKIEVIGNLSTKELVTLKKKLYSVHTNSPQTSSAPDGEIEKLRKELIQQKTDMKDIEKVLEKQAIKFFAANLEDFAKQLEKRFPKLVGQDQYYKDIHALEKRVKEVEVPDMSIVIARLGALETHTADMQKLMKSVSTRMPYIVE